MTTSANTQNTRGQQSPFTSAATVEAKIEIVIVPVADVDRAKQFYAGLGWRLDGDFSSGTDWRVVQMTPPGSQCSIMFGRGLTNAKPGSVQGTFLVVDDVEAARADLIAHGVKPSETFHFDGGLHVYADGRAPGPDPQHRSYATWASFSDPDGNTWLLQEVKTRLPGRMTPGRDFVMDAATLSEILQDAERHHGEYEPTAPKHHWSEWYAGFVLARARGKTSDEAAKDATARMRPAAH